MQGKVEVGSIRDTTRKIISKLFNKNSNIGAHLWSFTSWSPTKNFISNPLNLKTLCIYESGSYTTYLVLLSNLISQLVVLVLQLDWERGVVRSLEYHRAARLPHEAVAGARPDAIPERLQVQVGAFGWKKKKTLSHFNFIRIFRVRGNYLSKFILFYLLNLGLCADEFILSFVKLPMYRSLSLKFFIMKIRYIRIY